MVKNKWKNLRDKFKKELNKIQKCQLGDDGENAFRYNGTWCHFDSMMFLKSILTPKATKGNIEDSESTSLGTQMSQGSETEMDVASQPSEAKSNEELDDKISQPGTSSEPPAKRVKRVPRKQPNDDLEIILEKEINPITVQRKPKVPAKNERNLDEEFLRLEAKKVKRY